MKRISLAILLLLIPLCCVVFAALSKTTSIIVLDDWQPLLAGNMTTGSAGNISDSYATIMYLEIVTADADSQDGVGVIIEVSYGDDNWTLLSEFTTPNDTLLEAGALDGGVSATDTVVTLTTVSFDIEIIGTKWLIVDGIPSISESVRTKSVSGVNITLTHDLMEAHSSGDAVWGPVHEYIIPIPAAYAYVRVLINNTDLNADIYWTTRLSKVTSL